MWRLNPSKPAHPETPICPGVGYRFVANHKIICTCSIGANSHWSKPPASSSHVEASRFRTKRTNNSISLHSSHVEPSRFRTKRTNNSIPTDRSAHWSKRDASSSYVEASRFRTKRTNNSIPTGRSVPLRPRMSKCPASEQKEQTIQFPLVEASRFVLECRSVPLPNKKNKQFNFITFIKLAENTNGNHGAKISNH